MIASVSGREKRSGWKLKDLDHLADRALFSLKKSLYPASKHALDDDAGLSLCYIDKRRKADEIEQPMKRFSASSTTKSFLKWVCKTVPCGGR